MITPISYHAVFDASIADALRFAAANGFEGVQVAAECPHLSPLALTHGECDVLRGLMNDLGVYLTLHAPDDLASLYAVEPPLRAGVLAYYHDLLDRAARLGARLVTVHIGAMPRYGTDEEPRRLLVNEDTARFREALAENLEHLAALARGRATVCVENYGLDADAVALLAPHWRAGDLALCWDIAKAVDPQGRITPAAEALLHDHKAAILQVHLHDVRPGRSHCVLGTGAIDLADHLARLAGADVVDWCIEVRPREAAVASLAYLRQLAAKRLSPSAVEP